MIRPTSLKPIERRTLWDQAYLTLKAALLEGRYAPGARIILRDVADELGISLTPVRDAVNHLIAEKVLDRGGVGQGGGATVPLLDAHQFDQLMAIRASLEPLATAAAARLATAEELDGLERSMLDMKKSIESAQGARYLAAHNRFHFGIYKMSQLPIVQDVIEGAWLRCGPTLNLALPEYKPGLKRYSHHVDALNALKKRDADKAAAAIHADIESARADVYALLMDRQPN